MVKLLGVCLGSRIFSDFGGLSGTVSQNLRAVLGKFVC